MAIESLVVIGSGLAGYSFVKEFRALNADTKITLITADRGDYYSKPQLSTALAAGRSAGQLVMNTAQQMAEKFHITVLTHTRITRIDRALKKVIWEQDALSYDHLVLALGADVVHPSCLGDAVRTIQSVNTLEDYERFRGWLTDKKKIAILGSGLVGCEFANDLITAHKTIEMISLDRYPLSRFAPEIIGRVLQEALALQGVNWHLESYPNAVEYTAKGKRICLRDGRCIEADGIFSAIGLRAHTTLAAASGLETSLGIVVDRYLKTSDPFIYALGDCACVAGRMLQYIAPLLLCARALAKTLTGMPTEVVYPPMPIIVKTPACALSILPPPSGAEGMWIFSGEGFDREALFYDVDQRLRGFALSGTLVKKRAILIKEMVS